jgi:small-conductance mechanosensitive channel
VAGAALNFDVVYWVETADFIRYMDIQQEIYLQMIERFQQDGIELAFPAQALFMHDAREAREAREARPDAAPGAAPLPASAP